MSPNPIQARLDILGFHVLICYPPPNQSSLLLPLTALLPPTSGSSSGLWACPQSRGEGEQGAICWLGVLLELGELGCGTPKQPQS